MELIQARVDSETNLANSRQLSPTIAKHLCSLCRLSCAASHALISAAGFIPGNEIQAPIVLLAHRQRGFGALPGVALLYSGARCGYKVKRFCSLKIYIKERFFTFF